MTVRPQDAVPDTLLQLAGGTLALTGVLGVLVPAQFFLWWVLPSEATVALSGMAAAGLGCITLGWFVADGRVWATLAGAVAAPVMGIYCAAWALWCLANLSFTLFMFLTPPFALAATLLLPFAIGSARKCAAARELVESQAEGGLRFGS